MSDLVSAITMLVWCWMFGGGALVLALIVLMATLIRYFEAKTDQIEHHIKITDGILSKPPK